MNDKEILLRLLQLAYSDDALTPSARKEYEKLVVQFEEDGFEQDFPFESMSVEQANAFRTLQKHGYVETLFRYHGPDDGHILHVNLVGRRFFELAKGNQSVIDGMEDGGKREIFPTGAVRDTAEGKPRPDLLSPFALERVGEWLRLGCLKYPENNWMKGMNYSRIAASLHRHLMKFMQRNTAEDHLAAIIVNASFLMHYDAMIERGVMSELLDDLPDYSQIPGVHNNGDEILDYFNDEDEY